MCGTSETNSTELPSKESLIRLILKMGKRNTLKRKFALIPTKLKYESDFSDLN